MIVTDERIALKVNATGLIPVCGDERTVKGEIILANPCVRGRKLLSPSFGDGLGLGFGERFSGLIDVDVGFYQIDG